MSQRFPLGVALGVAACLQLATAAPASAHAELVSSDPANGATLDALPPEVVLTFSENVGQPAGLSVVAGDGTVLDAGELQVVDDTMRLPLGDNQASAGHYVIAYHVTSADGHPVGGELHFLVAGGPVDNGAVGAELPGTSVTDDNAVDPALTAVLAVTLAAALAAAVVAVQRVVRRLSLDDVT